jgi:hypothetical protein
VLPWTESEAIKIGKGFVNRLSVLAEGPRIEVWVNDEMLAEVKDDTFTEGSVALAAGTFDEGGVEIAFDNLSIWDLESPAPSTPDEIAKRVAEIKTQTPAFSDDFSLDNDQWSTECDEWECRFYARRAYRINASFFTKAVSLAPAEGTDFYLEVDTTDVLGLLDAEFGVLFRYVDGDNFYSYAISSDGAYMLDKWVNGEWEEVLPWTESEAIQMGEGATNRLGVLAEGSRIVL